MEKLIIGIDPGVHCGVAIIGSGRVTLHTMGFWECVQALEDLSKQRSEVDVAVYIEDVTQNKPTFNKKGVKNVHMFGKVSQNVGSNKRDCQLITEKCRLLGLRVNLVRPTSSSLTKLNAEQIERVTGYKGKSSSHSRDALMLIWGRQI